MGGLLFVFLLVLMLLGVPVAFSILLASAGFIALTDLTPMVIVGQRMMTGMNQFVLLAIPLFICTGYIMESTSLSKRLVDFVESIFGRVKGSMGIVTIVSSAIFAALTGSGPATVAAIGSIMMPAMVRSGYKRGTAAGIIAAGGALGPIIPPSGNMIVYGATMNLSISKMFIGGVIPGLFITLVLCLTNLLFSKKWELKKSEQPFSVKRALKCTWKAIPTLMLPVIILGGIYGGIFTPTEAAVASTVYALGFGFITREFNLKSLYNVLRRTVETSSTVVLILAVANLFGWILSSTRLPAIISEAVLAVVNNQYVYLGILMMLLFVVGALMDTLPSIIILAPILVPIGVNLGIDPLHLGVLFCITLTVGFVTPPFGINLFTAVSTTGESYNNVVKGVLPFMIAMMICVTIIAFVPWFTTWLPGLMFGG